MVTRMIGRSRRNVVACGALVVGLIGLASPASARADAVTDWNQVAAAALQSPGTATPPGAGQGAPSTVHLAMVHGAVYDAVNAIDGRHEPYVSAPAAEPWYSQDAAVAAAARHVLVNGGLGIPAAPHARDRGRLPGDARPDTGRAGEGRRNRHRRSGRGATCSPRAPGTVASGRSASRSRPCRARGGWCRRRRRLTRGPG